MLVLAGSNMVIANNHTYMLHIKFVLPHFNCSQISCNLSLNHNILLRKGGRERKTDYANSSHTANFWEIYLRFSELNSDSRNRRNWSRPTWSFNISSKEKPHLFTRCWLGSLLLGEQRFDKQSIPGKTLCHSLSSNPDLLCCHMPKGNASNSSERFCTTCMNSKCRPLHNSTSQ